MLGFVHRSRFASCRRPNAASQNALAVRPLGWKRRAVIAAFLNQKGGVGKTTLALHVAGAWAAQGKRVVVFDADPQGSALDWSEQRAKEGLPRLFGVVGLEPSPASGGPHLPPAARCAVRLEPLWRPHRDCAGDRGSLANHEPPVLTARVGQRLVFADAARTGRLVSEGAAPAPRNLQGPGRDNSIYYWLRD